MDTGQAVAAGIGALVGLSPVLLKWAASRSEFGIRRREVELAKAQVEFWEAWFKAKREFTSAERLDELRDAVSVELDLVSERLACQAPPKLHLRRGLAERVFLAYTPQTTAGWIYHTLFYVVGGLLLALIVYTSVSFISRPPGPEELKRDVTTLAAAVVIALIPAFVLQLLANRADHNYWQFQIEYKHRNIDIE